MRTPAFSTRHVTVYEGDVRAVLADLESESVDCVVTSPPYWGLRSYGTPPQVWGGDPVHVHVWDEVVDDRRAQKGDEGSTLRDRGQNQITAGRFVTETATCSCGAWRGEYGLEPSPDIYLEHTVLIFREIRRVLRRHGTLWLNIGDSYTSGGRDQRDEGRSLNANGRLDGLLEKGKRAGTPLGLKPKDMVGIPWRVAFALQADGWYLRSDIIWAKPNPMPESVLDRPTKAHEYLFLLTKSARYYYDGEAIREPMVTQDFRRPYGSEGAWAVDGRPDAQRHGGEMRKTAPLESSPEGQGVLLEIDGVPVVTMRTKQPSGWVIGAGKSHEVLDGPGRYIDEEHAMRDVDLAPKAGATPRNDGDRWNENEGRGFVPTMQGRNARSVWEIPTQPYPAAHFATFPEELPRRAILAGCPALVCSTCGKPQTRMIETSYIPHDNAKSQGKTTFGARTQGDLSQGRLRPQESKYGRATRVDTTTGYTDCGHGTYARGVVLDPFAGSGTSLAVARDLGRSAIGIELQPEYVRLIETRCAQEALEL